MHGKVKWFNNQKKYGFILGPDGREYFAHFSEILIEGYKTLMKNEEVTFNPDHEKRRATEIRIIKPRVKRERFLKVSA